MIQVRSLREFDTKFTAPMFAFPTVDEYYRESSSSRYMANVKRPLLHLFPLDDPV